ncbi:outer membrane beta-barrel protein [Bradyrhizobium sp. 151]|uniref:outer membrane protein n=1 Tax=Bradyrhizobium sp. 151 TaxID=2782626 RepID=UPI001FF7E24F
MAWQNNRGEIANNNEFWDESFAGFPRHVTQFDYGRFGWTVGAGIEQALTPAWSLKFEYDYMSFDETRLATPPDHAGSAICDHPPAQAAFLAAISCDRWDNDVQVR